MDEQTKETAWEEFVKSEPYFNPRGLYEVYKQMFMAGLKAGYEIRSREEFEDWKGTSMFDLGL